MLIAGSLARAQQPTGQGPVGWLYYLVVIPAARAYSPLTDIGPDNVQRLQGPGNGSTGIAAGARLFREHAAHDRRGADVTTPANNVAAVDAETGKEQWRFDGKAEELALLSGSGWKLRGTAFWRDGGKLRLF